MIAYAITDPFTLSFLDVDTYLKRILLKGASMVVYRDKTSHDYPSFATQFLSHAKKYNFEKVLLHGDYLLASKLKADGIHLRSDQLDTIPYAKEKKLFVIASTHSTHEAILAQNLGADMVTISPIYSTPNKGKPIGLENLANTAKMLEIPIIALGGILTQSQIKECAKAGAKGFASIRYFA